MLLTEIERLKETRNEFIINGDKEQKEQYEGDMLLIGLFMQQSIDLFKKIADYQKGIAEIQKTIIVDQNKLEERIRRLEENERYYLGNE